jgi:hypothetical protein
VLSDVKVRLQLNADKLEALEYQRGLVDNSRQTKLRKSSRLAQSRHYKAVEKVGHALQLSEDRMAEIDTEVQLWIHCEPGDLPVKTLALVANTSKLPKRIVGLYKLSSVAPQLESPCFINP